MKRLGNLKYSGIEVAKSKNCIFLSQHKYILDLLAKNGMLSCKYVTTPIKQNHRLYYCEDESLTNISRYQKLVGKIIYLSLTRPDIAYIVRAVNQFMHNLRKPHILKYLKHVPRKGLIFKKHGNLRIDGYGDADWVGAAADRRSTSGYFNFVGGNLATWRSKSQLVVARSSVEAEK